MASQELNTPRTENSCIFAGYRIETERDLLFFAVKPQQNKIYFRFNPPTTKVSFWGSGLLLSNPLYHLRPFIVEPVISPPAFRYL